LIELAQRHATTFRRFIPTRPLLAHAAHGETRELEQALTTEEAAERERDRLYWSPLRAELERLRHSQ